MDLTAIVLRKQAQISHLQRRNAALRGEITYLSRLVETLTKIEIDISSGKTTRKSPKRMERAKRAVFGAVVMTLHFTDTVVDAII